MFQFETLLKTILVGLLASSPAYAAIQNPFEAHGLKGESRPLDLDYVQKLMEIAHAPSPIRTEEFIPMDMEASSDEGAVFGRVAGKTLDAILGSSTVRQSQVGGLVQQLDTTVEAKIGESSNIRLRLDASRAMARLTFTGVVTAEARYLAGDQAFEAEIVKELSKTVKIVVAHVDNPFESANTLSLRMTW